MEDRPGDETRSGSEELGQRQDRRKEDQIRGRRPRGWPRKRVERQEKEENQEKIQQSLNEMKNQILDNYVFVPNFCFNNYGSENKNKSSFHLSTVLLT